MCDPKMWVFACSLSYELHCLFNIDLMRRNLPTSEPQFQEVMCMVILAPTSIEFGVGGSTSSYKYGMVL